MEYLMVAVILPAFVSLLILDVIVNIAPKKLESLVWYVVKMRLPPKIQKRTYQYFVRDFRQEKSTILKLKMVVSLMLTIRDVAAPESEDKDGK